MKNKFLLFFLAITVSGIIFSSCEDEGSNDTVISSYNSTKSHNAGKNCMSCHKSGGNGEGRFQAAGTVYKQDITTVFPGTTVKLTSEPQGAGTVFAILEVDKKGNFYTTNSIDFTKDVYVSLSFANSNTQFMYTKLTSGQCNSCHGVNINKIWIN